MPAPTARSSHTADVEGERQAAQVSDSSCTQDDDDRLNVGREGIGCRTRSHSSNSGGSSGVGSIAELSALRLSRT
jgi:hypothetical protein